MDARVLELAEKIYAANAANVSQLSGYEPLRDGDIKPLKIIAGNCINIAQVFYEVKKEYDK